MIRLTLHEAMASVLERNAGGWMDRDAIAKVITRERLSRRPSDGQPPHSCRFRGTESIAWTTGPDAVATPSVKIVDRGAPGWLALFTVGAPSRWTTRSGGLRLSRW